MVFSSINYEEIIIFQEADDAKKIIKDKKEIEEITKHKKHLLSIKNEFRQFRVFFRDFYGFNHLKQNLINNEHKEKLLKINDQARPWILLLYSIAIVRLMKEKIQVF